MSDPNTCFGTVYLLSDLIDKGDVTLGRGNVISKIDIRNNPGSYPIYSSSAQKNGKMGSYGSFMFDEELISWSVDGGGYFFYRPKHKFSLTNVSGYMRLSSRWSYSFIAYLLQSQHQHLSFDYQSKAHPSVIRDLYYFPDVCLVEQQKIAAILSSVDDVIEKTRVQIDKLKDLKTGMMQELLTQGIGHTEFKDSPVGRIPASWGVFTLGDLSSLVTSGSRGWAEYYSATGPIFIRIGNLTREHINLRFNDTVHVNLPDSVEGKRTQLQDGDVLISITADLGVIGVFNSSIGESYVNQHIALVRLKKPKLARWVGHFLSLGTSQRQFIENNDAGAKAGLNLPTIRKVLVALPSYSELKKIVCVLDLIDEAIEKKRQKLAYVVNLKKALMQDLLTGKVRVKLDQPETTAA